MTGWKSVLLIGIGVGAIPVIIGLLSGNVGLGLGVGLLIALVTMYNASIGIGVHEPSAWRGREHEGSFEGSPRADLDEELRDLLYSASKAARRRLEDGKLGAFVMYEAADGDVRLREVREADPDRWLPRARETARAVEDARRVVAVAPTEILRLEGHRGPVILFEAAEHGVRERTLQFVQGYQPKRGLRGGGLTTRLQYIGDGEHVLRFRVNAAGDA